MHREAIGWPPEKPRNLLHHPMVVRLAHDWRRPIREVEASLSISAFLDECEARCWLFDCDNPPRPPEPPKKGAK